MKIAATALISSLITAALILSIIFVPEWLNTSRTSPLGVFQSEKEKPLDKYTFERLSTYAPVPSKIALEGVITQEDTYTSYLMTYDSSGQKVSGQLNKPKLEGRRPVIIMLRGFVPLDIYETGIGTRNAAAVFADNGFVTVAPDFLGYGSSDMPDADSFAARVRRPVTVLDLLSSVKELDFVDTDKIFFWGHSNGGQIALSILEITGQDYPTVLWAPVTKPFPYSILYFTDEGPDYGRNLRKALATFEILYDPNNYSIMSYLDRIKAPIQLHQGGQDEAVPLYWSDDFVEALKETNGEEAKINYFIYPQSDHNMRPDWNTVVARDLDFYKSFLAQ